MSDEEQTSKPSSSGRSLPRVIGLVCIAFCSLYLSAVSTYQILRASLSPDIVATEHTCRSGTQALYQSLEAARLKVGQTTLAERDALNTFRSQLSPVWDQAPAVRALCKKSGDKQALQALRSVELLRYAEERTVRYNAIDLTKWRRRAPELVETLNAPTKKNSL